MKGVRISKKRESIKEQNRRFRDTDELMYSKKFEDRAAAISARHDMEDAIMVENVFAKLSTDALVHDEPEVDTELKSLYFISERKAKYKGQNVSAHVTVLGEFVRNNRSKK
jgi:hypothetical protein